MDQHTVLTGIGISGGIGIGRVVVLPEFDFDTSKQKADPEEASRFLNAVAALSAAIGQKQETAGAEQAEILESHMMLLGDPSISAEAQRIIEAENCNSEYAVDQVFETYAALFLASGDELFAARAADLRDIKNNLLLILDGKALFDVESLPPGSVLVAREVTTTVAAGINPDNVCALVTREGGATSHTAIIARSLGLPGVAGVSRIEAGSQVIVDGNRGKVILNPTSKVLETYRGLQEEQKARKQTLEAYRGLESVTTDGKSMVLFANIGLVTDIAHAVAADAEGIGLFRTEFLYMNRSTAPSEEEQFTAYKQVATAFAEKPVIVRTLDVGGDKEIAYLGIEKEENPFLGWRAIRFCLERQGLFHTQLRAILRASAFGRVKIMLPMISCASELKRAKALIEEVKRELSAGGILLNQQIEVGIMIETPAAVLMVDYFAQEADFFSIGTNDLTQYIMAVDRGNQNVAQLCSVYQPAMLRAIYQVAQAANRHGIECGICGEAGADPLLTRFFIGCGVHELSMTSNAILGIRERVRSGRYEVAKERVAAGIHTLRDVEQAAAFLQSI
ncbi:MAG: phosphoenolpyruvate--protein phosphotransferase [Oscillospiraceae bacterium]|nr:phosphoenolpyruvate--protein phosphotransferase [Oscillospiraceae bacterium]